MRFYDEKQNIWVDIRDTSAYKQRKGQIRDIWIALLVIMIFLPLGAQIGVALIAALLSFCYLDEVPYANMRKDIDR